jgi:Tfp pilus assembly protein PilF
MQGRKPVMDARWSVLIIVLVALALRLMAVSQLGDLPLSRTPQLDSLEYVRAAERIVRDGVAWGDYPEHAPGYAFFLAMWMALGSSLTQIRVVQSLVGAVSCVLTARIAARSLVPKAFLPAGLLQAVYAPFIYLDTAILAEPLLIFLSLLAMDLALRAANRRWSWLAVGVAIGAACIVRPTALLLLVPLAVLALRGAATSHRLTPLIAGAALVISPIVLQHWRVSGAALIQGYGGMNFYLGNTPRGDGGARARLGGTWDELEADASRAGEARTAQDSFFVRKAFDEIAAVPIGFARVVLNKAVWLTQQEELRDSHSLYFFREHMPLLAWLPGFGLILALAATTVLPPRHVQDPWPLLLAAAMMALAVIGLVVGLRYRAPMVPFVIAMAGAGVARMATLDTRNARRELAISAVVVVAILVASNLRSDALSRNVAEEWALTGLSLRQEGNATLAEDAYRRALALDDRSALAWDGLGVVLQSQERYADARASFERAIAVNDRYALAWYHVAGARDRGGDVTGALLAYRRALNIAPERTEIVLAYGLTLHREGRLDEAAPALEKAASRGEGRAYVALALTAVQRGEIATARDHAREAVRLLPGYGPARDLLTRLESAGR